jgi:sulfite reductase (ferredoxin)
MNACGQHTLASIGFQGMTIKVGALVAPASQLLLGGGNLGDGRGRFADKVLKLPARRSPDALRRLLHDYAQHQLPDEPFHVYYDRQGSDYFYQMLKDLSLVDNLTQADYTDWGNEAEYIRAIGVGECAGVVVDMVATLLVESDEKLDNAEAALQAGRYADSIYWAYTAMLYGAKALLTSTDAVLNTQAAIVRHFDAHFTETGAFDLGQSFHDIIHQMQAQPPTPGFAEQYLQDARLVRQHIHHIRNTQLDHATI